MGQLPKDGEANTSFSDSDIFLFFLNHNLVLKKRKRQDFQQICRCECSGREGGFVELWNEGGRGICKFVCVSEYVSVCGVSVCP